MLEPELYPAKEARMLAGEGNMSETPGFWVGWRRDAVVGFEAMVVVVVLRAVVVVVLGAVVESVLRNTGVSHVSFCPSVAIEETCIATSPASWGGGMCSSARRRRGQPNRQVRALYRPGTLPMKTARTAEKS